MGSWEEAKDVLKGFSIKKSSVEPKSTKDEFVPIEKSSSVGIKKRKNISKSD